MRLTTRDAARVVPMGAINDRVQDISNSQLVNEVNRSFPMALQQVKNLAPHFRGATDRQTIKQTFDWVCDNLRYKKDGETQRVKLPAELLRSGVADCKSLSLFIAAILKACGIPVKLRYSGYKKEDPTPSHVYVHTAYGPVDPTLGIQKGKAKLFSEAPYHHKYDYDMNFQRIGNLPPAGYNRPINGWLQDKYNQVKNWAFEQAKKENEKPTGNTILLKPARNAYLWLLKRNHLNWAKALNVFLLRDADRLKRQWLGLGGDFTQLRKAIEVGRTKETKVMGISDGGTVAALTAAGAVITAMTGLVVEAQKLLGKEDTIKTAPGGSTSTDTTPNPGPTTNKATTGLLPILLIGGGLWYGLSN